jgi:hypothetical protein
MKRILLVLLIATAATPRMARPQAGVCRNANSGPNCGAQNPPTKCNDDAWNQYQKHLHAAISLYDDGFSDSKRALEEFQEAGEDIEKDFSGGLAFRGTFTSTAEIAGLDQELQELYSSFVVAGKNVPNMVGPTVTVSAEVVTAIGEISAAIYQLNEALDNLNAASRSEDRMFQRGDAEWDAALAALQQALTAASCPQDQAGLQAQQSLDARAKQYLDSLPLNANGTYHIGDQNYDGQAALAKVKAILQAAGQSGSRPVAQVYLASYAPRADVVLTVAQWQQAVAQLKLANQQFGAQGPVIVARLAAFQRILNALRVVHSQMGNR